VAVTIIRAARPHADYLVLSNAVARDQRLSYRARGVLIEILSRPDNWTTSATRLARTGPDGKATGEGRGAMLSVLRELRDAGYVRHETVRSSNGQLATVTYVFDAPESGEPESVDCTPVDPRSNEAKPLVAPESGEPESVDCTPKEVLTEEVPTKKYLVDEDSANAPSSSRRKKPKTSKPETTLPDDWQPRDTHRTYAEDKGLDLAFEAEQFRSWHLSHDNMYADWGQAFWTWLHRTVQRRLNGQHRNGSNGYRRAQPFDRPSPTSPPLEILDDPEALDAFYAQFAPEGSEL
jgi:hypothetical protein